MFIKTPSGPAPPASVSALLTSVPCGQDPLVTGSPKVVLRAVLWRLEAEYALDRWAERFVGAVYAANPTARSPFALFDFRF